MEFRNLTPFPAQNFEGIDQHDQAFHVVALRQTLSFASGKLAYADEQEPLCEVDEFFGAMNQSSVRQESDFCQYKPRCDVIVNATAYAPKDRMTQFDVRLRVFNTGEHTLPKAPQGLNYRMEAPPEEILAWRQEVKRIQSLPPPEFDLIDKALTVCGERHFLKGGLLGLNGWTLTDPKPITKLPLRYEYALGGQCRIDVNETEALKRLPKERWMTAEQRTSHPEKDNPPVVHTTYEANVAGRGYSQAWYWEATKCSNVLAPQITYRNAPIDGKLFAQIAYDKTPDAKAATPAGFGIRSKGHPQRRVLLGKVDDAFIKSDAWLPQDFDFAVWNAAPLDQQIDFPSGKEVIELTNLCAPDTPGATRDKNGNTILRLTLLDEPCVLLMRMHNGTMFFHPMQIDTVIVEPEAQTVSIVWRAVFGKDGMVRAVDARLHRGFETGFTDRINETLDKEKIDVSQLTKAAQAAQGGQHG
jgi:hypothetical protein